MTNENEHTYRYVDAADVKRAETEQLVYLKELELEKRKMNVAARADVLCLLLPED